MSIFTKSDLKNGDVVLCRNGLVYIVVFVAGTQILLSKEGTFNRLSTYNANLADIYDHNFDELFATPAFSCETGGRVCYFSSSVVAYDAIRTIGEDRIKKYLFGVK